MPCRRFAAALADAFIDDPVFTWLLPGGARRESRLRMFFAAEIEQYVLPNGLPEGGPPVWRMRRPPA
jgi:hypothetical protein